MGHAESNIDSADFKQQQDKKILGLGPSWKIKTVSLKSISGFYKK